LLCKDASVDWIKVGFMEKLREFLQEFGFIKEEDDTENDKII
jgi:hypothetical protein